MSEIGGTKFCTDCQTTKPSAEFGSNLRSSDGLARYCRRCFARRSQASYRRRRAAQGKAVRERHAAPEGHKRCPQCAEVKPISCFARNRSSRDGLTPYCKPCHNARGRASRDKAGGARRYHLMRRYGMTPEEFDALVAEQEGVCAVCGDGEAVHVDHDHATGRVRGILCFNCNNGLGNFRDDPDTLEAAIRYLGGVKWRKFLEAPGVYRVLSSPLG